MVSFHPLSLGLVVGPLSKWPFPPWLIKDYDPITTLCGPVLGAHPLPSTENPKLDKLSKGSCAQCLKQQFLFWLVRTTPTLLRPFAHHLVGKIGKICCDPLLITIRTAQTFLFGKKTQKLPTLGIVLVIFSDDEQRVSNHRNETHRSFRFHAPILSFGEPGFLGPVHQPGNGNPPFPNREIHHHSWWRKSSQLYYIDPGETILRC